MPPFLKSNQTDDTHPFETFREGKTLLNIREPRFNFLLDIYKRQIDLVSADEEILDITRNTLFEFGVRYSYVGHTKGNLTFAILGIPKSEYLKNVLLKELRESKTRDLEYAKPRSIFADNVSMETLDERFANWFAGDETVRELAQEIFTNVVDDEEYYFIALIK